MGQKVHPYGFRLVSIRKPRSRWFAEGEQYRRQLIEDIKVREYIRDLQRNAGISNIIIDRTADTVAITIEAARPGIMIGRGGRDVDRLRHQIQDMVDAKLRINVEETPEPDTCAQLVAENIAWQIERRVSPRRAMGQAMERALAQGAEGVRAEIAGRIGGAEIARREKMGPEGRVPLQTLRADIDYGITEAKTSYGHIGVKVWIYKGEILPPKKKEETDVWEELEEEAERRERQDEAASEEARSTAREEEPAVAAVSSEVEKAVSTGQPEAESEQETEVEQPEQVEQAEADADQPEDSGKAVTEPTTMVEAVEEAPEDVDA